MPYSSVDRDMWDDPWFGELIAVDAPDLLRLGRDARLLFLYLWTNTRVNAACCYLLPMRTAAFEVGFSGAKDPDFVAALNEITDRVTVFEREGLVWVHNFVKNQPASPRYYQGVANCLREIVPPSIAMQIVEYNANLAPPIHIPYRNGIDTASVPDHTRTDHTIPEQEKLKAPAQQTRRATPAALPDHGPARESWPKELEALQSVPGYPTDEAKDRVLFDALAQTYPQLNLAREVLQMKTWLASRGLLPLKGVSGSRQRVRRWMQKADDFSTRGGHDERQQSGNALTRDQAENAAASWV